VLPARTSPSEVIDVAMAPRRLGRALVPTLLMAPTGLILLVMIVGPLLAVAAYSVFDQAPPGAHLTWAQWATALSFQQVYLGLVVRSLGLAALVTVLTVAAAYPMAYALALVVRRNQMTWLALVMVPFLTSSLLLIYSFIVLFQPGGPVMAPLAALHLVAPGASIVYTPYAVVLVLLYEYVPYMVLTLYTSLEQIDRSLLDAARSLGAGRRTLFWRVLLPLSAPGLAVGAVLVFPPVAGAFVEPEILGGPNAFFIGNAIQNQIVQVYDWPLAACLSLLLLFAVLVCLGALQAAVAAGRLIGARRSKAAGGAMPAVAEAAS
jgi:spermidine/putrescine transport system permease protein